MQNKLIILFFISLFSILNYSNVLGEEQFNFNVSEIEILENGNKFRGLNRGEIIANNGLAINADEFEYNRKTNILDAKGNIVIKYPLKKYQIYANKISYLKNENLIILNEKVKFIDENNRIINAKQISYNSFKDIFVASGNAKIFDPNENFTIYSENISYLKKQNIIKTENKSKIIDNDKKTITAEKFLFDLSKNILSANDNVKIYDPVNKYDISSEKITYYKNKEEIVTEGKTYSSIGSRYNLKSQDLNFFNKRKKISSKKKASFTDKKNKTHYQLNNFSLSLQDEILKGENITVNTDIDQPYNDKYFLKSGFFDLKNQSFFTQNIDIKLKKDLFGNKDNDPRIKGISSSSKDGVTTINKGIFTSCKENNNCTPWSIQAKKIEYDQNKKQITYDDALLKIYDTPILYFPKFFHPGPTVKRQSGFLPPKISNSQTLGSSIQTPYYVALSDNKDYTFSPTLFSKNVFKFQNEYRQENKESSFVADFSFVNGYKSKTDNKENSITHIFSKYSSNLNLENFIDSTLDLSVQKVSNDTYLKVFNQNIMETKAKPKNLDTLTSRLELDLNHEDYDLTTGFVAFEDLQKNESDRYEFALPYYIFSKDIWTESTMGSLNFTSSGDNILKDTNNLRSRMINNFDFKSFNFINQKGIKNNFNIYIKNLIASAKNDPEYSSKVENELMGIAELQTSLPLVKTEDKFINYLDPKISLRINPSDMINYSEEDRRINNDNLFDINRLGLVDTLESGNSLTLGIDYKKESLDNINQYFELKLGTVFRDEDNNRIPLNSAITQKQSNIFGSLKNSFNDNLSLNYQFSINSDLNIIEYNSVGVNFKNDKFTTEFNFIEEQGVIGNTNILENKTTLKMNNENLLSFETRQNRELDLTEYYNLIYEYQNDCLIAGVKYNKTYYSDRDLRPSEDLMFTVTLIPITSIGQSINK